MVTDLEVVFEGETMPMSRFSKLLNIRLGREKMKKEHEKAQRVCKCCEQEKPKEDFLFLRGKQCTRCYKDKANARKMKYYRTNPEFRAKRRIIGRRYDRSPKGIGTRITNIYKWFDRNLSCSEKQYQTMYRLLRLYEYSLDAPIYENVNLYGVIGEDYKIARKF